MTEAPAASALERAASRRAGVGERRRRRLAPLEVVPELAPAPADALASRRSRRTGTWPSGLVADLHCECGRPDCRETFPAVAVVHRGGTGHVIVAPHHYLGLGAVLRAADQYFVVDVNTRLPQQ